MPDPEETQDELLKRSSGAPTDLDPDHPDLRPLAARFDLLAELGRGGMGIVYKARDRETGDVVALKVLRPEIAARPDLTERFKAELRLARKITHKNVCRVYDLDRFEQVAAISMEYIEGESLRRLLERVEGLSVRHALKILRQVLAGLSEAHAQGVVHRDLKPENILIARHGTVKVMDFGIALSVEAEAAPTATLAGTPAYMSPEQAEGRPADARSDLYSLGLVMYEMFTGQHAFGARTPVALARKQVRETPPLPRSVEPDLPERIDRAIQKCLEKDPRKRFPSVAELEAALTEQPAPSVAPEGEPIPSPHLLRWQNFDRVLLALGVVGLLYFLVFRSRVFPVSQMRLQVDAIGARRAVEELAARLGRPLPETLQAETQLEFRGSWYHEAVLSSFFPARGGELPSLRSRAPAKPLVVWQITLPNPGDPLEGFATVDRKGKVEQLHLRGWIPGDYQPRPLEERRAIAGRAAEQACGLLASTSAGRWPEAGQHPGAGLATGELEMKETSGGEQGASYTASWKRKRPAASLPAVEIALFAEKVVDVRCNIQQEVGYLATPPLRRAVLWFTGTVASVLLGLLFVLGRCYRLPSLWKRLPLALVLGLVGVWMVSQDLGETADLGAAVSAHPLPLLLLDGIAAVGLALLALATAEHYLRRREPGRAASYLLAWRGRIGEPAVGLAVLRGALAGLTLAALETLLAHVTLAADEAIGPGRRLLREPLRMIFSFVVDPTPVGQAMRTFSPPLFAVAAALFDAAVIALIFVALPKALLGGWLSRLAERRRGVWRGLSRFQLLSTISLPWFLSGFNLHMAAFLVPPMGMILGFLLEAVLLVWLLERYDLLTVMAAVATTALWIINYPLLVIFREVGNTAHWAVFLAWAGVVLLGGALAFRSALDRARQRLAAAFQ